jgi:hypothetical protein
MTDSSASVKFGRRRVAIGFNLKKGEYGGYCLLPRCNERGMFTSEFVQFLKNPDFALKLCQELEKVPFKAVNIEMDLSTDLNKYDQVKINIQEEPELKGKWPNYKNFEKWMSNWEGLGYAHSYVKPNTRTRVVIPGETEKDFSHLKTWLKNSDDEEKTVLMSLLASNIEKFSVGSVYVCSNPGRESWFNLCLIGKHSDKS